MLAVTILGNNSAVPAFDRHPTCQIVTVGNELYMIDCGEGTQSQLLKYKVKRSKISAIFISHLHGDHYFGLIGLITTFGLIGRTQDLTIFAPLHLKEIIDLQLKAANVTLPYKLSYGLIEKAGLLVENNKVKISCFPTNHRIQCFGFKFEEVKNPRKINPTACIQNEIPAAFYNQLQLGENYIKKDGVVLQNEILTYPNTNPKSYAFCADTKYDESILPHIKEANLMYHETTYLDNLKDKAAERFHSTSKEAATMALKANAKQLLIGHFSSKYENLDDFKTEARSIFPNTKIAKEGVSFMVGATIN
jgi:ribonuclease Z